MVELTDAKRSLFLTGGTASCLPPSEHSHLRALACAELVVRLRRESREFVRWWSARDVGETRAGRKVLHRGGRTFPFVHASFQSHDDPALRLVIYTPSGKGT